MRGIEVILQIVDLMGKKNFLIQRAKKNLRSIKLNFFQQKIYLLKVELSNQAPKEL